MPRRKYTLDLTNIKTDSQAKYYWLGFIAGDGNIAKNQARLRIELKDDDIEHLKKFNDFMGSNTPLISRINNKGCHCTCLSINSAELKRYLAQYNLVPAKSKIFTIPINNIPNEYIYDFLRGLFDADGCLTFRQTDVNHKFPILEFTVGNKECAEQIHSILKLDTKISTYTYKGKESAYLVRKEGLETVKSILEKIYKHSTENTRLKRKYELWSLIK